MSLQWIKGLCQVTRRQHSYFAVATLSSLNQYVIPCSFSIGKPLSTMADNQSLPRMVGVCQMTSKLDKEENFATCQKLIAKAKLKGAQMVFLPEAFDFVGPSKEETVKMAEPLDGELIHRYKAVAKQHGVWLSLGGLHEKDTSISTSRIFNTHLVISDGGQIVATYRKAHLFDVTLQSGQKLHESEYVLPGNEITSPVSTPVGKLGLGICYDLRFPEFSIALAQLGAEILTYPSAFTLLTGSAHWEVLLRSRAIENQCYVIAAAQTGTHNPKRASFGHAMVVDPWGFIIAQCHEGTDVAVAEIDPAFAKKVHSDMPVWSHRRHDLYGKIMVRSGSRSSIKDDDHYEFGQVKLRGSQLFFKTELSMAFVNRKPVRPGHVLVAPLRGAVRTADLTHEELCDLFSCVQQVQNVVEKVHNVSSSTVTIQDGPEAGRSIQHLHVHILPRRAGDFERNDMVYEELASHDKAEAPGKLRGEAEMAQEAAHLRSHFTNGNTP